MGNLSDEITRVKQAVPLEAYASAHLERSGRAYVCPACGSGTHAHGTPALSIKGEKWHCFSCGQGGDVLDLAGIIERTDDKREQLRAVASWAGVPIEDAPSKPRRQATAPRNNEPGVSAHASTNGTSTNATAPQTDYSEGRAREAAYIAESRKHLEDQEAVAYLESRGWDFDSADECGFGYDPARRRIVIPWEGSDYYHVDRAIDADARAKYTKPATEKVGPQPLYNPAALTDASGLFFVTEGVFDALAVRRCGFQAVMLGSTSDAGHQLRAAMLKAGPRVSTALIMLDNDDAGSNGAAKLETELKEAGLPCKIIAWSKYCGCKDIDEAERVGDSCGTKAFRAWLTDEADLAISDLHAEQQREYAEALKNLHVLDSSEVADMLHHGDTTAPRAVSTGFRLLDIVLDGGLRQGLHAIGAVSSLGKTTITIQIADYVASQGRDALFVTIEQSASELVAKSLSRITLENGGGKPFTALTDLEILDPWKRDEWRQSQCDALTQACERYDDEIAPHMHILEGREQPSVSQIATIAAGMAEHDGMAPVVFIDYLQLLKAPDPRDTDKTATDKNIMALRQLARDLRTPVFVVSSLNRASYSGRISMEAFKESGAIEYGTDVLLGMQPAGMPADPDEKGAKAKAKEILNKNKDAQVRDCELVVLKNRHGRTKTDGIPLSFDSLHSYFKVAARP